MGSYMIWCMKFKDAVSSVHFVEMMKNETIEAREIHDHNMEEEEGYGEIYYDMGYLGYAEAEELKDKLIDIGVIELKQICLCDIDDATVIVHITNNKGGEDNGSTRTN